jgi:hypothetical protein
MLPLPPLRAGLGLLLAGFLCLNALAQPPSLPNTNPTNNDDGSGGTTSNTTNTRFWQCVTPTGNFTVALKDITSVSIHEYTVDGAARVTEMNVGTTGSLIARFYFLEAVSANSPLSTLEAAQSRIREVANSAANRVTGQDGAWEGVVKNYPLSTHAHTVEYRVPDKGTVQKLFESAEKAWMEGRGTKITVGKE